MSISKKFVWRLGLWSLLIIYILLDVLLFKGPVEKIAKKLTDDRPRFENDAERGIASRVFNRPIYLSQVDFAVDQKLWATGRTRKGIEGKQLFFLRADALRGIQDQYILREKVKPNADDYPVSDIEINAAIARFTARFKTIKEMKENLKTFGLKGVKELRFRLAAQLQQEKYILTKIKPGIAVTDTDCEKWYANFKDKTRTPERVKAQHIFISRLPAPGQTMKAKASYAKAKLNAVLSEYQSATTGKKEHLFTTNAAAYSEDERTKSKGGKLGWIRRGRIAKDFTDACFTAKLNTAKIITTKLGWHLIIVIDKKAEKTRNYEEIKPEIVLAIETIRRKEQIEIYRVNLRKQHGSYIKTNWDIVRSPW